MNNILASIKDWGWENWAVIVAYLIFTTVMGELLKGKQSTIKDLFLGGKRLPWWAVSGSIIATEISAVTFIIAPMIVFKIGGNFSYLQLAIGTILARFIIGYLIVPAYYKRDIFSPYQYMGMRLGPRVDRVTSLIFFAGAILGQGVRVYVTAIVLQTVLGIDLGLSIAIIGIFSILWTLIGGITTVIWTDVIQFVVFIIGAVAALFFAAKGVPDGLAGIIEAGKEANKFEMWDFSFNLKTNYTLWTAIFGSTILTMASHGTDQMMAQRMFCCKDEGDARKAIVWSSTSQIITILMMVVGVSLFAYYQQNPMSPEHQALLTDDPKNIFPIFIRFVMPKYLSGLIIASVFAAAISSLDSTLAALSQSSITTFYKPYINSKGSEQHYMFASKCFIVFWGVALSVMAYYCDSIAGNFKNIIDMALGMTSYTYGALLGCLLLALLPFQRDDRGLIWAIPLSISFVVGMSWHNTTVNSLILIVLVCMVIAGFVYLPKKEWWKNIPLWVMIGIILVINNVHYLSVENVSFLDADKCMPLFNSKVAFEDLSPIKWAWPWNFPSGCLITIFFGWFLGRPKKRTAEFEYEYDEDGVLAKN